MIVHYCIIKSIGHCAIYQATRCAKLPNVVKIIYGKRIFENKTKYIRQYLLKIRGDSFYKKIRKKTGVKNSFSCY